MFNLDPYYIGSIFFGSLVGVYLFSVLFRYALLGRSGKKLHQLWVILLTGIVAVGFSAFADGTDGFMNRITNQPTMLRVTTYSLAALVVAFFVSWRIDATPSPSKVPTKREIAGRAFALVLVLPMIAIGLGNIAGTAYGLTVYGTPSGPGLGVSKAEMRRIMLDGKMAPFWRTVDDKAPEDMDYIIDQMFANEANYRSVEDGRQQLNREIGNYRISLATYAPALRDTQRIEILRSSLDTLRAFESEPELCVDFVMTGGQGFSQKQLLQVQDHLNHSLILMTESLIEARKNASLGAQMPVPPTDEDYGKLVNELIARGVTQDGLQALFNEDSRYPKFCSLQIKFFETLLDMKGAAGEAVRFEITQGILTAAP